MMLLVTCDDWNRGHVLSQESLEDLRVEALHETHLPASNERVVVETRRRVDFDHNVGHRGTIDRFR